MSSWQAQLRVGSRYYAWVVTGANPDAALQEAASDLGITNPFSVGLSVGNENAWVVLDGLSPDPIWTFTISRHVLVRNTGNVHSRFRVNLSLNSKRYDGQGVGAKNAMVELEVPPGTTVGEGVNIDLPLMPLGKIDILAAVVALTPERTTALDSRTVVNIPSNDYF